MQPKISPEGMFSLSSMREVEGTRDTSWRPEPSVMTKTRGCHCDIHPKTRSSCPGWATTTAAFPKEERGSGAHKQARGISRPPGIRLCSGTVIDLSSNLSFYRVARQQKIGTARPDV